MSLRLSLADFIEEELLRAPLTFDAVIDAVHDQWRQSMAIAGRGGGEMARMLQLQRGPLLAAALRTLRLAAARSVQSAPHAAASQVGAARKVELSLVDESDVVADLETGGCAERIKSDAEAELREVHAYTSALVGDLAVSRDTNPFRPEHFARALWDGCQTLPAPPAVRIDAFRRGVPALARGVRSSLAAACERMAAQGITPATYRTLVFPPMPGGQAPDRVHAPPEDLTTLRDSMLGALNATTAHSAGLDDDMATLASEPAAAPASNDQQLGEVMRRLYDEIAGGLPAEVIALLHSLRPAFERIATRDEGMIDRFDHPVWQFIDRMAFMVATTPPAERQRLLGLARNLIAHLDADKVPDAARFAWAADKLEAHDRQSLALAMRAATADIRRLLQTAPAAADSTADGANVEAQTLDIGSLDTVPGDLLNSPRAPGDTERGALSQAAQGDRLRVFLQSEWRTMQLLWSRDDLWLLRDLADGRRWALRPGVIERLIGERLLTPLRMRSLVRRAADRMQRIL